MGKRPEVSLEKRAEINVLLSEGLSQKDIASRLGISQSAVSKIIKRIIEFGTYTPKPRPGRPRVNGKVRMKPSKNNNENINMKNSYNARGLGTIDSFHGIAEGNFFLSLCEIENTLKNGNDSSNEYESVDSQNEKFSYRAMKKEKPDTRSSFEMEEIPNFVDVNNSQDDNSSGFIKVEGRKKIKSEFKRPSEIMRVEDKYNSARVQNHRNHINMEDKRPPKFKKPDVKLQPVFRPEEVIIPHRKIKREKNFYDENDGYHNDNDDDDYRNINYEYANCEDNDENNFYDINYHSSNKMSYNNGKEEYDDNQHLYPCFSKSKPSQPKKKMGYFRIYDKSIKRRPRKSDIQIKPTTFVKISERKRFYEKRRSSLKSTSPLKNRFQKEQF